MPVNNPGPTEYEGYSPNAANTDTEAAYGAMGAAPLTNQETQATETDTTGVSAAGIGAALPGGSTTDTIPWSGSGQLGGMTGPGQLQGNSGYTVAEQVEGQYGWPSGSPDTAEVYGGAKPTSPVTPASPYPWLPTSTLLGASGVIDTTVSGGSNLVPSMFPSPNAYRTPSSYVAAGVKDTTLTDILGNQVTASPLTDVAYAGTNVDTSYIGAPAAPASLSVQVDTITATQAGVPYYASQQGILPSTLVVNDVTSAHVLVLNTDYTVTTALNGPNTSLFINLIHVTNWTAGDTVTLTYSFGSPQYYDSNLPPAQSLQVIDTLYLSQAPAQLSAYGVVTAASALVVFDVTQNVALTFNTDYTVTTVTQPFTPFSTYTEVPPITYAISWKPTSAVAKLGDTITVTYSYSTSVPGTPSVGSTSVQTDNIATFNATPVALSRNGIVTPPASLTVQDITNGKTLVLNVDYNITITGTGSTLNYSIVRLAGSTNSALNDNVHVTYSYGNAAYFTSGPVLPQNRGILVPWTPPAGTTEVDYYLIQNSTFGTMYVPATGQPGLYGQPSPAGGSSGGQPVYQTDTFTNFTNAGNSAPAAPTMSNATTGGTVTAGVVQGKVTYVNANGESLPSAAGSTTTTTATSTVTVNSPSAQAGATGYNVYLTAVGGTAFTKQNSTPIAIGTNFTITAPPTSTGAAPPFLNTTIPTLTKTGVIIPGGQLIVRDLTSTQNDPLQPTGTVLEFGYDYTVTAVGNGPWLTYQVQLVTTSVNAKAGDTITVSYWYDQMGAFPLTAIADVVTASARVATLSQKDIVIPLANLIVYDVTISKALAQGVDYTVSTAGLGPAEAVTITLITTGTAGAGVSDQLRVYYLYGVVLTAYFTQGLRTNDVPIYKPSGVTYAFTGYQFRVAAGNRAGLGPFSGWSDFAVPLNYNAPQPGHQGSTQSGTGFIDPANSVNPIYLPSGAIKAGTGLGV